MITLEKVKLIIEKKNDNPDQLSLFGDNGDKKNKKSKAQQYTDKINKQNKNRPESKRGKRVFPGDKSGAYQAAKSDLEAREGLKKAGASGDVSKTAGPEIRKKVETKRQARVKSLRLPDTSFDAKPSKKPIRPFGQVGRDKAPEGLFGPGDTKGQMTAKRMDRGSFKKTQATSDLLPKSFKDFDKKLKSLKVDTDIERRISNPKTASIINKTKTTKRRYNTKGGGYEKLAKNIGVKLDPKSKTIPSQNPDLMARRALGAAGSDSNFSSAEPVPSRPFKPSKTFVDKVRKSRASRKAKSKVDSKFTQTNIFDQPKKSDVKFSSGAKGKFASGSVDLGNTDAKFANRQRIKEPPKFDGQQNIFNDPNFDKKTKNNKRNQRNRISGGGQKKKFKQLKIDLDNNRRTILNTGRGERIRAPRTFKQGSVINPEIFTGSTPFDKKNTSLKTDNINISQRELKRRTDELEKGIETRVKDMMKKAKQNVSYTPSTKQAQTLGRYKRFKSYMKGRGAGRILKTGFKKLPKLGKAAVIAAPFIAGAAIYNAAANKGKLKAKDYKAVPYRLASGKKIDRKSTNELDRELMDAQRNTLSKKLLNQMSGTGRYQKTASYDFVKNNKIYRKNVEKTVKERGYKPIMKDGKFQNYSGDPYGILGKKA